MVKRARKARWICPTCGRIFVQRTREHTCAKYDLGAHFERCPAWVRTAFDRLVRVARKQGEVRVTPVKSGILLAGAVNFGSVAPRRAGFRLSVLVSGRVAHPRLVSSHAYSQMQAAHAFSITDAAQVDDALVSMVERACQEAQRD